MSLDLNAIHHRAMIMRNLFSTQEERREALAQASDDILSLLREVESLRKAASPEALKLSENLRNIQLMPIDAGERGDLADDIANQIYWAIVSEMRKSSPEDSQILNTAAFSIGLKIITKIDKFIQKQLSK